MKGFGYFGLGNMCGARKPEPEQLEQKGLEIIAGYAPIELSLNGYSIGKISKYDDVYKFFSDGYPKLDSETLKTIAAKLDELNGVYIDRDKLENELQRLLVSNSFGMSSSDIMANKDRIKEIRNILNNP